MEAEVDRWVTSYKRAIDEHRVNLLREVAQIRQAKLEQVQTQKEGLAGRAAHVSQAVAFTQDLLAEASDTEVSYYTRNSHSKIFCDKRIHRVQHWKKTH